MSYYNTTEEQQFNEVKNWFKANGTPIVIAIFVIAASTFGWNFWKNKQIEDAQRTSAVYQATLESFSQDSTKNAPLIEKFIADNQGSSYAVFALLEQAKIAAEKSDYATVKNQLQQALQGTSDATLQNVIRFRLAAVDYQLKQYDDALATLANVKDGAWDLRKFVLTGDILAAKGDIVAARSAYEQAKQIAAPEDQLLLDVRLNNLQ